MDTANLMFAMAFAFVFWISISESISIEELKPINYEVEIVRLPVRREEMPDRPFVQMKSIYGQDYQCFLPQVEDEEASEKEAVDEKNIDIKELLAPLKKGSCLLKSKDWWTYEFCFGLYIKQFHIEDGRILGQVLTLGVYESEFDWDNETDKERFKNVKQRYHSQTYVNGTKCDLTGQPRNAEVRFFCEEGVTDYIYRVDEPGTCSYVITIHTSRLCVHPMLKPPPSKKAHSIPCHPVLSNEQYTKYMDKLEEEKTLAETKREQWLLEQQERLQAMKSENLRQSAEKASLGEGTVEEISLEELNTNSNSKPEDKTGSKETKKESTNNKPEEKESASNAQEAKLKNLAKQLVEEKEEVIDQLKMKMKTLPEKFKSARNKIKDILVMTEGDEGVNLEWLKDAQESDQDRVTTTLMQMLEKLHKAENEIAKSSKTLAKMFNMEDKEKGENAPADDDSFISEVRSEPGKKAEEESSDNLDDDDTEQLTVRIRKLDRMKSESGVPQYEMATEQKEKLEQAVKEKLEKVGLDTGGRKIEVKIITGYYDNEGTKEFQQLTDDESNQFQNMIMALLMGQKEALMEIERHKTLEDNYKFAWDENEDNEE